MRTFAVLLAGLAAVLSPPCVSAQTGQPAMASASALARTLTADLPCSSPPARISTTYEERVAQSQAHLSDVLAALSEIAAAAEICAPLREEAQGLAVAMAVASAPPDHRASSPSTTVSALVIDAFTEAERRAANPVFESPPPPRNLTRGRISTP
jgi:hypothetical protein